MPYEGVRVYIDDILVYGSTKQQHDSRLRELYQLPTVEDIASDLAGNKYFSKLDASSGFYQIPLDEKGVRVYIDDILVYGSTKQQHDSRLDGVDIRDDIVVIDNDDEQIDEKGYKTASGRIVRKPDRLYYNNSAAD
ncbi:hypothetical protein QE152_g6651 [Popillia japonica]|uniref:Reverse transcriptase n=1 Tax=Popillia japonica TaxID=7064 RepID=A0AAW1MI59_POPJA